MTILFNYTSELRSFFESLPENSDTTISHRKVIENGRKKLFDFDYPIFDENYRNVFETHFIRHFYMRQIGFETFGLFRFHLETWLIINMPYFNKLFESELLKYDPLTNSQMESTYNKKIDKTKNDSKSTTNQIDRTGKTTTNDTTNMEGESTTESERHDNASTTDTRFNRELESINPDSRLSITPNADGSGVIEYANNIKENKENDSKTSELDGTETNTQTSTLSNVTTGKADITDNVEGSTEETATSNINDIEDFIEHRTGKIGVQSYAKLVQDYRAALLRVEQQIFKEMNDLFMLVY